MNKRKYPMVFFVFGVALNLARYWPCLVAALLLFFIPGIPAILPQSILVAWLLLALVTQLKYRKISLSQSDNEGFNDFLDMAFGSTQSRDEDKEDK